MSGAPQQAQPPEKTPRPFNRKLALICLGVSVAIAVWVVVKTELRVADLQARGFSDAATGSARDHAYLPLLGAYAGALVSIGIVAAIKRIFRRGD